MPLYASPNRCCTSDLDAADGLLARAGVITNLTFSPRTRAPSPYPFPGSLPIPGTVATATLMVNGVETALTATHSIDINGTNAVSNSNARVTVQAGDRIALKFERVAGQCAYWLSHRSQCGSYRAGLLLE